MAFIIVQHLAPDHDSMMVDLLAGHTAMPVAQAVDGIAVESDRVYAIPPGAYLAVDGRGAMRVTEPTAPHGGRLPFDFLLNSLALAHGPRAVCVVLSGTGADGALGVKAVKEAGGLAIAQDPEEAEYDGMPRSAIATGGVDLVLPAAKIAEALIARAGGRLVLPGQWKSSEPDSVERLLPQIVDLLRKKTPHNFTGYKTGTLERRIERRLAVVGANSPADYLDILHRDAGECDRLAKDLLINVTSFFRDKPVFEFLATTVVPELVRDQPADRPLRIWVAGCSTGEETYSLAILFREEIDAARRDVKLQIFASDVDPDAVASAREGLYPPSIEDQVSPERLRRCFTREGASYRVSHELRDCVVFATHDLLADPPFTRIDFVSCRNLLIYLLPVTQAKVISILHFALREGGLLLLGDVESIGADDGRFGVVSKLQGVYRRVGRARSGEFAATTGDGGRLRLLSGPGPARSRPAAYADICRKMVLDGYAPAAVLINAKLECLFFQGPTDRYLRIPSGRPGQDLIAIAREGVRARLGAAVQSALRGNAQAASPRGDTSGASGFAALRIVVDPVVVEREQLFLVCFVEGPTADVSPGGGATTGAGRDVAELERELEATRIELQAAVRNLESSSEEQVAINEEALSVNEEFQATNEELLASKEELQSLNEELTALNGQLQETLERQRTAANDLQNVLYSTKIATIFLDPDLNIRFFTPATRALFNVIASDVGRPLADLKPLAADEDLQVDAWRVLEKKIPVEREVEGQNGAWFVRRILPYRTLDEKIEGVVITFEDVTERRRAANALAAARRQAELASLAKSRFLAAASHDLRQPLQTLELLQSLLSKKVAGEEAMLLVKRIDETLGAMTGMLNTLLDINQIELGAVKPETTDFLVNDVLGGLTDELTVNAQAAGLTLRAVPCTLRVRSDRRLLEEMVRNLLSNAIKYTRRGKVLVGCRRRAGTVSLEVWDNGIGIPERELESVFEEYRQLDVLAGRRRGDGLGLGLSIVRSLGELLGHPIRVRSLPGKGSVFSIEVPLSPRGGVATPERQRPVADEKAAAAPGAGAILVIEDEADVREPLRALLEREGYRVSTAADGDEAFATLAGDAPRPDLILADYNLPHGMNGVQAAQRLRLALDRRIPVIILTGDISTATARDIARYDCVHFGKPVKLRELTRAIAALLPNPPAPPEAPAPSVAAGPRPSGPPTIVVIDDDNQVRAAICAVLEDAGRAVRSFASSEAFLAASPPVAASFLLVDAYLPGMSGLDLLKQLKAEGHLLPAIMITGHGDVPIAVEAMKAGALDFIEKPIAAPDLIASIERAYDLSKGSPKRQGLREQAIARLEGLTPRQREILQQVLAGRQSKAIAFALGISQRTVESHRAMIMQRTGAKSLASLARLALLASDDGS